MGIPDHLTCLLRNLYVGQEAIVRTEHGTTDWFQIGKGVHQGCILSPCLFNFYAEYIMRNTGLEEVQGGIKIAGRISNPLNFRLSGSSVHGISQARILEWVYIFSSRGSSQLRDPTCFFCVSCTVRQILYH